MEQISLDPRLSALPGVIHGFGTRAFSEDDLRTFAGERNFRPVLLGQIHSDIVHVVEEEPAERPQGDALVTKKPGLLLVIKTADCLPLLLADVRGTVVATVHAGWRGTRARIVEKAVRIMTDQFHIEPSDLVAAMGPCIGPSCYEVGEDVRCEFLESGFPAGLFVPAGHPGKYLFNLPEANDLQLQSVGLSPDRIRVVPVCTHCEPELYSFRRDRNTADRLFSFIGISPE